MKIAALFIALTLPLPLMAEQAACMKGKTVKFDRAIEESRSLVQNFMDKNNMVGLSIALSVCDKLVWSQGFGLADLENNIPVTPKTKFRIASVSKTLTATALAQLYEQGNLQFDREIHHYVPSFPAKKFPITTRQLAGHLAGIRHYKGNEFYMMKNYPHVMDGLKIFQNDALLHEPGTKYLYSSYGWNLLSAIIENTSQMDYLDYMQKNILMPLNMHQTVADRNRQVITNRGRFYHVDKNGQVSNAPYVDNSYKWAGGGYLSTAEDLVKFGNAMLSNRLMKKESFRLLTTSQKTNDGLPTHYGMGWSTNIFQNNIKSLELEYGSEISGRVFSILKDQNLVGHSGGAVGGKTLFWVLPKSGISVAAISNSNIAPTIALSVTAEFVEQIKIHNAEK